MVALAEIQYAKHWAFPYEWDRVEMGPRVASALSWCVEAPPLYVAKAAASLPEFGIR
jgi:hypothetical protein